MSDNRKWVSWLLVGAIALIFVGSFLLAPRPASDDQEAFAGSDAVITETLEDQGVEPWFTPIFEPGSGEIESGLFALQAAIGAGLLGYVLGNLRGRAKGRGQAAAEFGRPEAVPGSLATPPESSS